MDGWNATGDEVLRGIKKDRFYFFEGARLECAADRLWTDVAGEGEKRCVCEGSLFVSGGISSRSDARFLFHFALYIPLWSRVYSFLSSSCRRFTSIYFLCSTVLYIYTARVVFLLAAEYLNSFIFFSFSSPCHISNRFYSFHHTGVPLADCPCQYDDGAFAALYTRKTTKKRTQLDPGYWLLDIGP